MVKVSREDALNFMSIAMRNWSIVPRIDEDDLEDMRKALEEFKNKRDN